MPPLAILAAVNASLALAEQLLPLVAKLRASGEVSVDQQKEVEAKLESLRARAAGEFSAPHWKIDPS